MRLVYDPSELIRGVTNGIRVDPHSVTGAYVSDEKDTVSYRLGLWIRMHDM
jgi:hypothetical protein